MLQERTRRRVVELTAHGGPEVLRVIEDDLGEPPAGTVRMQAEAVGVNFADALVRRGAYLPDAPLDLRPGVEVVGRVLHTGERVAGFVDDGGYASVVDVPVDRIVPVPDGLDAVAAAAVLIQGATAHAACHLVGQVRAGDTVLVDAAAGGVGRHVIAIASAAGARVVAAASSLAKLGPAAAAGHAVVTTGDDLATQVRAAAPDGIDLFVDSIGGSVLESGFRTLRTGGRLVVVGAASLQTSAIDTRRLIPRSLTFSAFTLAGLAARHPGEPRRALAEALRLAADGVIDASATVLPLTHAAQAHRLLEDRSHVGKLVLVPEE